MGLLDNMPGLDTPQGQGLLSAAFSLMSAKKLPGQKGAFAGALGEAGQQYLQSSNASQDQMMKRKYLDMQMQEAQSTIDARKLAGAKQAELMKYLDGRFGQPDFAGGQSALGATAAAGGAPGPTRQAASAMPPSSGGLNMSPVELARLKLLGVDLTDVAKLGIPSQLGNGWVQGIDGRREYMGDPTKGFASDGKSVSLMPGFLSANNAIEGGKAQAVESAKAGLDLVEVPMSDGSKKMMPRSQAVQALGGQRPSASQIKAQPMAAGGQSGYSMPTAGETAQEQIRIIRSEYDKEQDPQNKAALGRELMRLGSPQSAALGQTQTPAQIGQQQNITAAGGKVNDAWLKNSLEPVMMAGQAAQSVIDSTNVARTAMRSMGGTGWGTETKASALNVLTGLGIAPKTAEMYASNAQIFQRSAMDRLWSTLNTAKGPQTEGDADRAAKTYGKLSNTPQANEFIFDLAQATAERDKMKAAFFKNALPIAQQSGDLMEVERQWDKRSPSIFNMPTMNKWGKK
jgi:hypothetical protein